MRLPSLFLFVVLIASTARAQTRPEIVVRHHTAGPWIVFGVGWAVILGGFVTELLSQPMSGNSCGSCPSYPPTDSARAGQIAGWIGVGTGAAMVAGGLVWHVSEPTGPRLTVAPTVSGGGPGLMLRATF